MILRQCRADSSFCDSAVSPRECPAMIGPSNQSARAYALLLALVMAVCFVPATRTLGQVASSAPLLFTPSSPRDVAVAALAGLPVGQRVIVLSGFDSDIANYDQILVKSTAVAASRAPKASRSNRSSFTLVKNPAMVTGRFVVRSRVADWLKGLKEGGATVDRVIVQAPGAAIGGALARATFSHANALVKDSRAAAAFGGLTSSAARARTTTTFQSWSQVIAGAVSSLSFDAHRLAVQASFPSAVTERAKSGLVTQSPTSSGTQTGSGSTQSSSGGTQSGSTAGSQYSALTLATRHSSQAAMARVPAQEMLSPWRGGLAYRPNEWARAFEVAQTIPSVRQSIFAVDPSAQRTLQANPALYRRPTTLAGIDPSQLDASYKKAGANAEAFALAMADCAQSDFVRSAGLELAVMAAYTGRQDYLNKCIDILTAMRDRVPFQRPGWTLYTPNAVMPEGGDGVWLATSWGIEGVVGMLSALGDRVPAALRAELEGRIRAEVELITKDWADARPWYVRGRAFQSNQWIETSVGLVRACLFLKDPALIDAYNLGVQNLAASLGQLGRDGAFLEGVTYASMTSGTLFEVIEEMRATGDTRCSAFPWVDSAWRWWLNMVMPGRQFVNCYDSRMSEIPAWAIQNPLPSMMKAALASADSAAVPNLRAMFPGSPDASLSAVRYQVALAQVSQSGVSINRSGWFPSQQVLSWRSGWEAPSALQTAMAVWIRGGSPTDSHCHRDQGHVSVYNGNRIILMECGTPVYSTVDLDEKYANAAGHSTVQIGALSPRNAAVDAPISISHLADSGGDVSIELQRAFPGTISCSRNVRWSDSGTLTIVDRISLPAPVEPGTMLLRFHTGCNAPLDCVTTDTGDEVRWQGVTMRVSSNGHTQVTQNEWPDAVRAPFTHRAIDVSAKVSSSSFEIVTELSFNRSITTRDP